MTEIPDDLLDKIERALTEATTTALTLGAHPAMNEPYPDDPRWTPRTRWLDRMGSRAMDAKQSLRSYRRPVIDDPSAR